MSKLLHCFEPTANKKTLKVELMKFSTHAHKPKRNVYIIIDRNTAASKKTMMFSLFLNAWSHE
jgi:hypothetical protein